MDKAVENELSSIRNELKSIIHEIDRIQQEIQKYKGVGTERCAETLRYERDYLNRAHTTLLSVKSENLFEQAGKELSKIF